MSEIIETEVEELVPEVTKFYTFRQNNSGGVFIGPHYVIIEAFDAKQANEIAVDNKIYFNGCANGKDCSCCGDRWYRVEEYDGSETPEIWGEPLENYNPEKYKLIPYKAKHDEQIQ